VLPDPPSGVLRFLDFSLDAANAQLRRGDDIVALRPKTLAVLRHLAGRAGRLVTKAELLDAVWADTTVGEWVLSGCIRELRRALADDPREPRIIETAHRHGYRFIAAMASDGDGAEASPRPPTDPARARRTARAPAIVVGRGNNLGVLHAGLDRALGGERHVLLIAGEAGIGKTTLVDAFCAEIAAGDGDGAPGPWIARGQCLQQYGESEPYAPVLEAFARLASAPAGAPFGAALRRHAPAWLVQMPSLVEAADAAELQRALVGTTRERMLREATGLVEVLERPLVLVLEDLHWCDYATLDLLAAIARRPDPARLLVIGTYRPADLIVLEHPLKAVVQELAAHGGCRQLWLENLDAREVRHYLERRCPGLVGADEIGRVLYERTDGNLLFLRGVVDALIENGALVRDDGEVGRDGERWAAAVPVSEIGVGVPPGLAQMLQRQIDRLQPADRSVLEAASVVGRTPSAAAVAAAVDGDVVEVEERLDALARQGPLLRPLGAIAWPDGTIAGGYELTHALYQSVLRDGVPPARRRRLHRRIAERLEAAFADDRGEVAADLALHLEAAGETARAIPYREATAVRAVRRGASREAAAVLERTLALIGEMAPSSARTLQTIQVSLALGMARQSFAGLGDREAERLFDRVYALSAETDDAPQMFQAVAALAATYLTRAELAKARETTDQLSALAARIPFPAVLQVSDFFAGVVRYHMGPLSEAEAFFERAAAIETTAVVPVDFAARILGYLALTHLHAGRPDTAVAVLDRAIARAETMGTPFDRAQNLTVGCFIRFFLRDLAGLEAEAARAARLGDEHGFPLATGIAKIARGRVLAARGQHRPGGAAIRDGMADYRTAGQLLALPTELAILAESYADADAIDDALDVIDEARGLVATTADERYLPELWRLEGELRGRRAEPAARDCLERAVAIAVAHRSRWWELRARTSLVTWQRAHRKKRDVKPLALLLDAITEGRETPDVSAARAAITA
jgi:DNA-binding winged helix-turn-helix (wHTH) protein/tetratricopeptide (TPR) repeat protein